MKPGCYLSMLMVCIVVAVVSAGVCLGGQDKGAESMMLEGGVTGKVPFPHHRHQQVLADCKSCHDIFARKAGAIEKMKSQGTLEKKQVMNKLCVKCHRTKKRSGEKSGPTTCRQCHVKS